MKTRMKTPALVIAALLCGFAASAQEPQRGLYDFDYIKGSNPWLTSSNASGLGTLAPDKASVIEAVLRKENGGITPSYGSDNSIHADLKTESFIRVSDRVAFKGMLSYSFFNGKNMGGQMLMDPSYNPVNFVESDPANTGIKIRELFSAEGGMSYSFNEKWALGFNFDYQTGYQAKRKDPRPRNNWMYLDLTFGARYAPAKWFSVGANFEYRRTNEDILAKSFGSSDQLYYFMTDYGASYGTEEAFSTNSVVAESSENPMFNEFLGGSLQLVFGRTDKVQFFNEISFLKRDGAYGERTTNFNSLQYFFHEGNTISYNGVLNISGPRSLHKIRLCGEYSGLNNFENIYRINTVPGQQTTIEYFGENEVLTRTDIKGHLSYTGYIGTEDFRPKWEYGILVDGSMRTQSTTIYPFYRDHNVISVDAGLYGRRNIIFRKNIITVTVGAGYTMGFGTAKEDGILASSSSKAPKSLDVYLDKDFEYNTASRVCGTLAFRYTRLFGSRFSVFADLRDRYDYLLAEPQFLSGRNRNSMVLTIGCTF